MLLSLGLAPKLKTRISYVYAGKDYIDRSCVKIRPKMAEISPAQDELRVSRKWAKVDQKYFLVQSRQSQCLHSLENCSGNYNRKQLVLE